MIIAVAVLKKTGSKPQGQNQRGRYAEQRVRDKHTDMLKRDYAEVF